MDQLLPLVVRSNASPNSWLLPGVEVGAFFGAVATTVHAGDLVGGSFGLLLLVLSWLIWSVSTAWAMAVSTSRGGSGW